MQKFDNYFTSYKGKSRINLNPSDLLIPVHLEKFFLKRIRKHKTLKNYFHILIVRFRSKKQFSKFPDTAFKKTLYQSKNQKLIRYSFRPDHQDWYEAKCIGFYFGISVCHFFSRLVGLDREEDSGVFNFRNEFLEFRKPKTSGYLYFSLKIISEQKMIFKSLFQEKNFELNSA
ncbi:DUF1564 family protein [Leptospira sp. WS92.C1]